MTGQALIVQGDALRLPLPDASVDLIVTSPPYAFLRSYDTGYPHLEVGAEATPAEFLEHLWQATAEMVRVLKPTGSIFVMLGDKYGRPGGGVDVNPRSLAGVGNGYTQRVSTPTDGGGREKSLMGLPWRYAIGCMDGKAGDALILRAELIWSKPNGLLPESVTDRVRRSHEQVFHLTRFPRYYSAIDEVREPSVTGDRVMNQSYRGNGRSMPPRGPSDLDAVVRANNPLGKLPGSVWTIPSESLSLPGYFVLEDGTLRDFLAPSRGRPRPRTSSNGHGLFDLDPYAELAGGEDAGAWRWLRATGVAASPWPQTDAGLQLRTAASHYAAFPSRWPEQLIRAFSPPGICLDCGQGRAPVVERERVPTERQGAVEPAYRGGEIPGRSERRKGNNSLGTEPMATILGYACACTPHTNHPGSEWPDGWPKRTAWDLEHHAKNPVGNRPKSGPWREYHLDGWKPPPTRPAVILDPFSGVGTTIGVARRLGRIGIGVDLSHGYCRAAKWRVFNSESFGKAQSRTWLDRQGSLL